MPISLKVFNGILIAVFLVGFSSLVVSNIAADNKIEKLEEELAQEKQKNELLQEDNASMTDYIWNMNQKFMKEEAE